MNFDKNHPFFKNFSKSETDLILNISEDYAFKANEIIFKKGSSKYCGAVIVKSGKIVIYDDITKSPIDGFEAGEYFNISSLVFSRKRTFSATAKENSEIIFLEKSKMDSLMENDNEIGNILEKLSVEEYDKGKLFGIFRGLYGEKMDYKSHKEIYKKGKWVFLEDNSNLFNYGEKSDSFYLLVTGLLKAYIPKKGELIEVGEIYEGEVIGEMGILTNEARSASIFATRDSVVFKIDLEKANEIIMQYPLVLLQVATKIADRLRNVQHSNERHRTDIHSIVQLSSGKNHTKEIISIGNSLIDSMNKFNRSIVVSSKKVNEILNIESINAELGRDKFYPALDDLVDNFTKENRYLLLLCDEEYTPWTTWCLAISDKNIFVVEESAGVSNTELLNKMNLSEKDIPIHLHDEKQLIIYHQSKNSFPSKTSSIIEMLPKISNHYHMSINNKNDSDRVSRLIAKKGIGLCLSGGGAKGNAHIGVYKALIEHNIPIDAVCGTSAGGIVASLIAFGYDPETIISRLKETYKRNSFKEYTIPVTSIIATKKVIQDAIFLGNDMDIEDLWIPYFSIAVNISKSKLDVIDKGPVYKATRATAALPGILLPVIKDTSFLVDGGLINNMPGDIMLKKYGGKLISVSVSPQEDLDAKFNDFPNQSSYFIKKLLRMNKKFPHEIPGLSNILMRSIFVASSNKIKEVIDLSDLFLDLQVKDVGLLEFEKIDESVEFGYEYAMKKLKNFDKSSLSK
tara:strand:- start:203 stop:2419 length:2217 start_codon:yes stop_codon:yes gene_type:complete